MIIKCLSPRVAVRTVSSRVAANKKLEAQNMKIDAVNENICVVNLKMNGHLMGIIAVYMPHAGRCSDEQENVYNELTRFIKKAKRERRMIVIAGYFNAVVGKTYDTNHKGGNEYKLAQACGKF